MNHSNEKTVVGRSPKRRLPRQRLEGMTLVEIMIVVIIMAMIATAVGIAVVPALNRTRVRQTRTDAMTVQSAVTMYMSEDPSADCPTVAQLVESGTLNRANKTTDAWDNDFVIRCEGDSIVVISPGPNGNMGDEDDIGTAAE